MKRIAILFLALSLFGCADNSVPRNKENVCSLAKPGTCVEGKKADMSSYEEFTVEAKDHRFIKRNMEDVLTAFKEKKSGIFYFGFSTCPWCIEALPIMNEVASQKDLLIEYIDIKEKPESLDEQVQELGSYASEFIEKDEEGKFDLYVPLVLVVEKGVAKAAHEGTVDGHNSYERKMSEEEKNMLEKTYQNMF